MNSMAYAYISYLVITIGITIWVARTLRHNGVAFLVRTDTDLPYAEALSRLLIVGFYLVNFGAISFMMKSQEQVTDAQTGIELLSNKVGTILVALGIMHFLILMIFASVKQTNDDRNVLNERRLSATELAANRLARG